LEYLFGNDSIFTERFPWMQFSIGVNVLFFSAQVILDVMKELSGLSQFRPTINKSAALCLSISAALISIQANGQISPSPK